MILYYKIKYFNYQFIIKLKLIEHVKHFNSKKGKFALTYIIRLFDAQGF